MSDPGQNAAHTDAAGPGRSAFWLMALMFLVSGVAALVYQIVWAKELSLVFGVTLYATSAVVTAFMAGLALGSLYFGRIADRVRRPLMLFALLEAGIAAFALAFPGILTLLEYAYVALYGPFGGSFYVMSLVRFGLAVPVLIVPTALMGGTLPVIMRAYVMHSRRVGRDVAGLYSANNIGAFAGCVAAGYVLLELLGPRGTLMLGALLNLSVAATAMLLSKQLTPRGPAPAGPRRVGTAQVEAAPLSRPVKAALWVFGLEGVTSLVYQMAWMRLLIFFVRMDIFGVTAIISTFLAGLSLGAFLCRRWVDGLRNPYRALGIIEMGIGLTALATIPLLPYLLGVHISLRGLGSGGLPLNIVFSAANFGVTFLVILVPTAFMGATLPVVTRIYVDGLSNLGRKMGLLGCLDTVGSILGAFAGGFILIPIIGIQRTIILTALLNLALAGWIFAVDARRLGLRGLRPGLAAACGAAVAAAVLLAARPVPLVKYSHVLKGKPVMELVQYEEDQVASASVIEQKGFGRSLYLNDHPVASDVRHDWPSHELMMHVPLLLHPQPRHALIIGLGAGLSVQASLVHEVDVDVVELSTSVVEVNGSFVDGFREYRAEHGHGVLEDERVRVRIEDGRNFALASREDYDVIQVGGFHPVVTSGAAGFYSVDFYRDCRRLLTPDGIFTQWLPIHQIPHEDFKTILRSFHQGFPHTSIWFKYTTDFCLLMGSGKPIAVDLQRVERRMARPAVRDQIARCDVREVWDLLDSFCMSGSAIARAVGVGPLQTDRHPLIEYHRFREMPGDNLRNLSLLAASREPVRRYLVNVPAERWDEVQQQLATWYEATNALLEGQIRAADYRLTATDIYEENWRKADAAYRRAIELNPADRNAEFLWKRSLARYHMTIARYHTGRGDSAEATRHLRLSAEASPDTYWGAEAKFILEQAEQGITVNPR